MDASYRVRIEGYLLDDDNQGHRDDHGCQNDSLTKASLNNKTEENDESSQRSKGPLPPANKPRFSNFFHSLSVDFDCSRFRNGTGQNVEWKKPDATARNQAVANSNAANDFDELTFKRNGDENMNITINLFRQDSPERYQLSAELAEAIDMTEATQQEAVMALWEYIKLSGLQEDEEKRNFLCDDILKKVFLKNKEDFRAQT